tara:strand:- start:2815 stop:4476 length:1662 start_codon:yes stop_codon:yes gene_type:complete
MAEQTITSTPINAPDILRNQPLSRAVDVEIETQILDPVTFNYASASGGRARWVIPQKGVFDAPECALVFELTNSAMYDNVLAYPLHVGALSMIKQATLRCGGVIMSQVNNCNLYSVAKMQFKNQAVKEGVYDVRHMSHYKYRNRVQNAKIGTIAGNVGFHQIYNTELDQADEYGASYVAGANAHAIQATKCLQQTPGRSNEVSIKLADIFPVLKENKLPVLAMAQVEVEIEFERCGDATVAGPNITECAVIETPIPVNPAAAAQTCVVNMSRPNLICDFIHYDDEERQKIFDAVNSGAGMQINFTEVTHTRGTNPRFIAAGTAAQLPVAPIESNTIIGMAQKEVKKIYVLKNFDLHSAAGSLERDALLPYNAVANQRLTFNHRNITTRQFKSQQMVGEKYNFLINNQKIFNKDIDNPATQHQYISQCERSFNVPLLTYDTMNYSPAFLQHQLGTELVAGVQTQNNTVGRTQKYVPGSCNVIGINLDKYNPMGSTPGNGLRIGSAPIEFNYSCVKIESNGANDLKHTALVNLDFFIEYRRSMIITSLGVAVSDV